MSPTTARNLLQHQIVAALAASGVEARGLKIGSFGIVMDFDTEAVAQKAVALLASVGCLNATCANLEGDWSVVADLPA